MCPSSTRLKKDIVIHTRQTQRVLYCPYKHFQIYYIHVNREYKLHKPIDDRRYFRKMTTSEH